MLRDRGAMALTLQGLSTSSTAYNFLDSHTCERAAALARHVV